MLISFERNLMKKFHIYKLNGSLNINNYQLNNHNDLSNAYSYWKTGDFLRRLYEKENQMFKIQIIFIQKIIKVITVLMHCLLIQIMNRQIKLKIRGALILEIDKSFVNGKESASDIYSIRQQIEEMNFFEQFINTSSISGGTGSGFAKKLINTLLYSELGLKNKKVGFFIYPFQNYSNNVVESYTSVLSLYMITECLDSVILFDNESIYNISDKYLELDFINYNHINNVGFKNYINLKIYLLHSSTQKIK